MAVEAAVVSVLSSICLLFTGVGHYDYFHGVLKSCRILECNLETSFTNLVFRLSSGLLKLLNKFQVLFMVNCGGAFLGYLVGSSRVFNLKTDFL